MINRCVGQNCEGVRSISLILIISLVSIVYAQPFTANKWFSTVIFVDMALLGTWGIWVPAYTSKGSKQFKSTMNIVGACLAALLFVCYWVYVWPKWQMPALLTSLLVLMVIFTFVYSLVKKRKHKAKAQPVAESKQEVP